MNGLLDSPAAAIAAAAAHVVHADLDGVEADDVTARAADYPQGKVGVIKLGLTPGSTPEVAWATEYAHGVGRCKRRRALDSTPTDSPIPR